MPEVLATGFLVGLMEFACIKFINPHIEWPRSRPWHPYRPQPYGCPLPGFYGDGQGQTGKGGRTQALLCLEASDGVDPIGQATMSASSSMLKSSTPRWPAKKSVA